MHILEENNFRCFMFGRLFPRTALASVGRRFVHAGEVTYTPRLSFVAEQGTIPAYRAMDTEGKLSGNEPAPVPQALVHP